MALVDLTGLPIAARTPQLMDFGGTLTPPLGGPEQRVERAGSRWTFAFETPALSAADTRVWASRLSRAKSQGGIVRITQPGLIIGNPGAPVVATNIAAGKLIGLAGLTPGYAIGEGWWMSIIIGGRRYLDRVAIGGAAGGGGTAAITIQNLLRKPLVGGETVEIAVPKIEGLVEGDVDGALDATRTSRLAFTVRERA